MTPDTKIPERKPCKLLNLVAVKNGWMLYEYDEEQEHFRQMGCERRPTYVFNDIDALLLKVRELLAPGAPPVTIMGIVTPNPMDIGPDPIA